MKLPIFDKLKKNLDEISGTNTCKLSDILTTDFIQANTPFRSYDDMINKSGLELTETTAEELYLNEDLNEFIKQNTKFENFRALCVAATREYATNKVMDL